jgi:hypothetical protein
MGKAALDAGSFGDIWKGSLGGQEICIKVLKVFQKSDKVKLLKVRQASWSYLISCLNEWSPRSFHPRLLFGDS